MRRIIVTGGSRGIGAAVTRRFRDNGDRVCFFYYKSDINDSDGIKGDISDPEDVRRMMREAARRMGGVDVLVNNAGIAQSKLANDITDEDIRKITDTDLLGTFYCCREVISEFLKEHKGAIVNISSMWGQVGGAMECHYSAAKAGVIGLTKSLAKELGPSGIRVNCVAPGMIDTDMNAEYDDVAVNQLIDDTPLGRIGTPEDVAEAVFFLAGDCASFITGEVLSVNGGYVI